MDEKVRKEIEDAVASIFSEKEEAEARQKTQDALTTSAKAIEELTESLEGKNDEVAEMETKISEADEKIATLESELEAAKTEKATSDEKLAEAELKIEDMLKDKSADERMVELEEAGVIRKDKEAQRTKVREMSAEDFDSYRDELVSIREAVMKELQETKAASEEEKAEESKEDETEEETAEEESEEADEEEASEEDEVETPAANIDPGKAVAAAMNMEIFPSDDLKKKYGALGKAMAVDGGIRQEGQGTVQYRRLPV